MHVNTVNGSYSCPIHLHRFSGLTADNFVGVETTLEDVQNELTQLFFSDTILLGHSLESDLRALKVGWKIGLKSYFGIK